MTDEYPMNEGHIVTSDGESIAVEDFENRIRGTACRAFDRITLAGKEDRPVLFAWVRFPASD